jgi:hypothetical protein
MGRGDLDMDIGHPSPGGEAVICVVDSNYGWVGKIDCEDWAVSEAW